MSAWLLGKPDIRLVAQADSLYGDGLWDLDDLCAMLHAENVASVNARYPEGERAVAYRMTYQPVARGDDPHTFKVLALVAIHCYQYQSCEHRGWADSEARRLTDDLERRLVAALPPDMRPRPDSFGGLDFTTIPGYDDAPWALFSGGTCGAQFVVMLPGLGLVAA